MAFPIKQENYNKAPTAEQTKVFAQAFLLTAVDIHRLRVELEGEGPASSPLTRIGAHFLIRHILGHGNSHTPAALQRAQRYKAQLTTWRSARQVKRDQRKAALAALDQQSATATAAAQRVPF